MKKVTDYKREMNRNYMIFYPESEGRGQYAVRMLEQNSIQGLLTFQEKWMNCEVRYYYDITSKQPLARLLETRDMKAKEIRRLVSDLLFVLRQLERFLLDEAQLCLEPEYIYIEPETFHASFCLNPCQIPKRPFYQVLQDLAQYILDHVSYHDGDAVILAFSLIKESQKENFGIDDWMQLLGESNHVISSEGLSERTNMTGNMSEEHLKPISKGTLKNTSKNISESFPEGISKNFFKSVSENRSVCLSDVALKANSSILSNTSSNTDSLRSAGDSLSTGAVFLIRLLHILIMLMIPISIYFLMGIAGIFRYMWIILASEGIIFFLGIQFINTRKGRLRESESVTEADKTKYLKTGEFAATGENHCEEDWEVFFHEENETVNPSMSVSSSDSSVSDEIQTILLSSVPASEAAHKLSPQNGGPEISLPYFPFIIGKNKELADFCLLEPEVSRLHLRIDESGSGYTITDLNSTNGTRIDGHLLEANETYPVLPGSEIMIGTRKYLFC